MVIGLPMTGPRTSPDRREPRRPSRRRGAFALALAACVAAQASAQALPTRVQDASPRTQAAPVRAQDVPQVVDQGGGDRHSLSQSLRVMPVDLSPHGFERVYAVPGRDDLLMRTNGALYAVFDQSTYSRDPQRRGSMRAVVPAATVFYIGRPDFRIIRSTGMRDVDFSRGDRAPAERPSQSLGSVHGVTRLDGSPVDGRATDPGAQKLGATGPAHGPAPDAGTARARDGASSPANDGRDDRDARTSPAPAPVQGDRSVDADRAPQARPAAPPPGREEQPGFRERIDELLRRAKAPSGSR
jgi:hypothetical protein